MSPPKNANQERENGRGLSVLASWLEWPEVALEAWLDGIPSEYEYHTFRLRKRNRRGYRQIDAPNEPLLALQRRIYHRLLRSMPPHEAATGFTPSRSITDNAVPHVGQEVVINIDLKDFFPSIKERRVYGYWQYYGWGQQATIVLTNICCYRGRLPQGAPTSPALSNLVNRPLDARLDGLVRKFGGRYTRYADDLTFSFSRFGPRQRGFIRAVTKTLSDEGYEIQKKKRIRVQRPHQRQTVTGLVVNEKVNLPRAMRRKIRAMRHQLNVGTLSKKDKARLAGYEALLSMVKKGSMPFSEELEPGLTLPESLIGKRMAEQQELQVVDDMPERYTDFELHVAAGGHVTAKSNQGEATADISTEIPSNIRLSLKLIEKRAADAGLLEDIGLELYKWLFPGPIHTHFHQTEAVARTEHAKMRLRLRIEAEEIASLPLEFICRERGGYFLAINPATVLSRYLNLPLPPERVRRRTGPLHMLAVIADPTDLTRLPPDEWEAIIKEALAEPLANRQMTLQTVKRATRKAIRNALLKQKPDIIQFVGHGIYKNGKGYLALVDEKTGKTWRVDDKQFANLYLGHDDHLGLISLATCESAMSDDPQGFLGIAPKLVQRGAPAVLAMQYKVLIKTAKIFLEDFYTAVAARKPIDWATQSARNAISLELGLDNREFATPVLYMRAQDGNVFDGEMDKEL